MKKICSECGKEFDCLYNINCFCMKYSLSEANLKILKAKYKDCICEDCLKKYADVKSKE